MKGKEKREKEEGRGEKEGFITTIIITIIIY